MKDKLEESLRDKRGGNVRGMNSFYKMFNFHRTEATEEDRHREDKDRYITVQEQKHQSDSLLT